MHRKRKIIALIAVALLLTACTYKQALVLARDAAVSNAAFEQALVVARNDGFIPDNTEYANLLKASKRIAQLDDAAVNAIMNQHDKVGAIAQIDQAIATLDDLTTSGLAAIKNHDRQTAIHAILLAVRGTLISAKALLS